MTLILRTLLIIALVSTCGCAKLNYNKPLHEYDAGGVVLWKACSKAQADTLSSSKVPEDLLRSAACSAWLLESGAEKGAEYAKSEQDVVRRFLKNNPDSGLGHYLLAYLVAKEAQLAPLKGLDLVPVMEQEALLASRLAPEVDFAGPDRMLGELYLKAPSAPISIGDLGKSLNFYEKAVKIAPDFALNRLGLAEALLEDDKAEQACAQYSTAKKNGYYDVKLLKADLCAKLAKACNSTCRDEK